MDDSAAQFNRLELIKRYKRLRNQLINLIEEKEYLIKNRFFYLQAEYIKKIGYLEYELYELDIKLGQAKRRIELVQKSFESNTPVNLLSIEHEINNEFKDFSGILQLKDEELKIVNNFNEIEDNISEDEFIELKKYYRKTIKILHPDIHPNLTELQKSLWTKASLAYENGGLIYLKIIYKLAHDEYVNMPKLEEHSIDELITKLSFLEEKIDDYILEIEELKEGFPFNKENLLKDEAKIKEVQKELQRTIKDAKNILELMDKHFLLLLNERHYLN